ncbi:MAG: hypothetical protein J6R30_02685 [Bacteroidales bacterium]|nr:hypothetical protein [Bacteroidales bacterium]
MKRLLEYLLLFVVAAVLWGSADDAVSASSVKEMEEIVFNGSITQTSVSAQEHQCNLPRQTSIVNAPSVQNAARRTSSFQRNNLEFAKCGKIINSGLRYFIQLQSVTLHSSLAEPANMLLCLRRLII